MLHWLTGRLSGAAAVAVAVLVLTWPVAAASSLSTPATAGMGGAGVAVVGMGAMWDNPAGIFAYELPRLQTSMVIRDPEIKGGFGSYFQPDNGLGAGALGWQRYSADGVSTADEVQYTLAAKWNCAYIGGAVRWVRHSMSGSDTDVQGVALDLGMVANLGSGLNFGAAVQNAYATLPSGYAEPVLAAGLSGHAAEGLLLAADLVDVTDSGTELRLGAQYQLSSRLVARIGAAKGLDFELERWTMGVGVHSGAWIVDWAVQVDQEIVHQIGIGIDL